MLHAHFHKIRPLAFCSLLSILVHILLLFFMRMLGSYEFSAPVNQPFAVMVELAAAARAETPETTEPAVAEAPAPPPEQDRAVAKAPAMPEADPVPPEPKQPEPRREPLPEPEPAATPVKPSADHAVVARSVKMHPALAAEAEQAALASQAPSMLRTVSQSLASRYEKLSYLISMHGLPIGSAELESRNDQGVTVITLRVKSNPAVSGFFPVDNEIETRHIDGRLIMTTIKQQEGSFRSDQAFSINLRKKTVSWVDFITPRSVTMTVPTDDVLDTLSGIYYLRNRQLQVGKTETLNIFDSETYASVPVEVLRREEMRLPNLTKVATLVVRPLQKTPGIFRRTGDLLIWMTDDDFKVPVKIVTSIGLGDVTAELVSAESGRYDAEAKSGNTAADSHNTNLRNVSTFDLHKSGIQLTAVRH